MDSARPIKDNDYLDGLLRPMSMPSPITEGAVTVWWDRSPSDSHKIRQHIILDFGKTDYDPEVAANKATDVVRTVRKEFHVCLARIQQ